MADYAEIQIRGLQYFQNVGDYGQLGEFTALAGVNVSMT
jgi:hypothetical protein